jgi:hypothetical protein
MVDYCGSNGDTLLEPNTAKELRDVTAYFTSVYNAEFWVGLADNATIGATLVPTP